MGVKKWLPRALAVLALGGLLFWALRNAPLTEIWATVSRLQPWQIGALLGLNLFLYVLITLRWWLIVRAEARQVAFWPLVAVRLAVFGVSYFTLGPQIGGEALQVLALRQKYGLSYTHATATVLMDKLLEFLVNFLLLAVGLAAVFRAGFFPENGSQAAGSLVALGFLIAWPPLHLLLLARGRYPLSFFLKKFPRTRLTRFLRAAEHLAGRFCQRRFPALLAALGVSLLAGLGLLLDYALMLLFVGLRLPFGQVIAGWTAGWLSFLVPLPGGLGALEASQVFALGALGVSAATAISVTLLIRARDLLLGGVGLLIAGSVYNR
jgi:uncharacterized protein (TIRG00374 family)